MFGFGSNKELAGFGSNKEQARFGSNKAGRIWTALDGWIDEQAHSGRRLNNWQPEPGGEGGLEAVARLKGG